MARSKQSVGSLALGGCGPSETKLNIEVNIRWEAPQAPDSRSSGQHQALLSSLLFALRRLGTLLSGCMGKLGGWPGPMPLQKLTASAALGSLT